jgi:hypothetical protein
MLALISLASSASVPSANAKEGSIVYSRSRNAGEEIITLSFFQVNGTHFMIGVSTTKQYFLSLTSLLKDRIYLYALVSLLCSIIFVLILFFLLRLQGQEDKANEYFEIIKQKNCQIDELNQLYNSKNSLALSNNNIHDRLTNVYNKQFFFAVLDNAYKQHISPVVLS